MKVLITGGSGFIGIPLAQHLLERGDNVTILDLKEPSISHDNLNFINKSIMEDLKEEIKGCDLVVHLAAVVGVVNSDNRQLDTMDINLLGSVNVFKCAKEVGVHNIIYASSSEVYGNPRELPIREDSVKGPVSAYGVSKLASEIYAQAYNQKFDMNIKIVRFFNVYGPMQPANFVVPIFVQKALNEEDIGIFGDGSQTRCFTFVEDIIEGMLLVAEKGKAGEAYNIGNNHPTTILQLAELIKQASESRSEVKVLGFGKETRLQEREVNYRIPNISKIQELGWNPTTRIEQGVQEMIKAAKK